MSVLLEQHKALFRRQLEADWSEALMEIRGSHPGLRVEQLMELLKRERPELVEAAERIENDEWGAKPELPDAVSALVERITRRKSPRRILAQGEDKWPMLVRAVR